MAIRFQWRGPLGNDELNRLHAEAFDHPVLAHAWNAQLQRHSLGWVCAREDEHLVGFVNVPWDGDTHAFILDTIVARSHRRRGIGKRMVEICIVEARTAGCEWLHVDFDEGLDRFYIGACGFEPTPAGLLALNPDRALTDPAGR